MDFIDKKRPHQSPERDPCSNSNYWNFNINITKLHLDIDFDRKIVAGRVIYDLSKINHDCQILSLDTSYLNIDKILINGKSHPFIHNSPNLYGQRLDIELNHQIQNNFFLEIIYSTTENCTALQFLNKSQTDGKVAPYLFCQCQANHARSLLPCFDTPSVKSKFELSAKSPYFVLMSGQFIKKQGDEYFFNQPIPIPSYLLSIASGDLAKELIGPRSTIYSEPVNIQACKWEFERDTESFIQIAENLVYDYDWSTFDCLVLPNSFPYGGMEIPNLCQLTPTLICKDRSQVSVVAHELAHSWSGNLVTNCSWEHFWLNEGWTVYLERRIIGKIEENRARQQGRSNPKIYGEQMRHFLAIVGWTDLENSIKSMGKDSDKYSKLVLNLSGEDPDDSFSSVPYEKGFNLLLYLETLLGIEKWDKFIPQYFTNFKYKSLDTYQFIDFLYDFFKDEKLLLDSVDWETWLFKSGLPPKPKFDTTLADECYKLANKWLDATKLGNYDSFSHEDIANFHPNQSVVFLDTLLSFDKLSSFNWKDNSKALEKFDQIYGYKETLNTEILFRYYLLQVTGHSNKFCHLLGKWLGTVGRMKFVRPGYVLLNEVNQNLAIDYFKEFENNYHPICRNLVKKDLGLS